MNGHGHPRLAHEARKRLRLVRALRELCADGVTVQELTAAGELLGSVSYTLPRWPEEKPSTYTAEVLAQQAEFELRLLAGVIDATIASASYRSGREPAVSALERVRSERWRAEDTLDRLLDQLHLLDAPTSTTEPAEDPCEPMCDVQASGERAHVRRRCDDPEEL